MKSGEFKVFYEDECRFKQTLSITRAWFLKYFCPDGIQNVFNEGELKEEVAIRNFRHATQHSASRLSSNTSKQNPTTNRQRPVARSQPISHHFHTLILQLESYYEQPAASCQPPVAIPLFLPKLYPRCKLDLKFPLLIGINHISL